MSAVKRAKWIEGITQSKRILHDIAEIVTTANRNEEGVVKEENWELVFPRPFQEHPIDRGALLQSTEHSRRYVPVKSHQERVIVDGVVANSLANKKIVESTVVVKNEDLTVTHKKTVDYTIDAVNGTITRVESGAIKDADEIVVSYGTSIHRILESIPVKVEKVLLVSNPNREIDPAEYLIDYANKTIQFLTTAPTDAAHFALTFTEIAGAFNRIVQEKLQLIPDPLDVTGLTFRLPPGTGDIGKNDIDIRVVAQASTSAIGIGGGGAIQYEMSEASHKIKFLSEPPTLEANQALYINIYESTDPPANSNYTPRSYLLVKDLSGGPNDYIVNGAINRFNSGMPHHLEVHTTTEKIVLFKHLSSLHAGYEELDVDDFLVDYENPQITVLRDVTEELRVTLMARDDDDLSIGFSKIKDRIVLKTTTKPEQFFAPVIGTDYGATDTSESLTMYVEIQKPDRLVNPESGLTRYVDYKGMQHETQRNNHYIQTRMFNEWDDEKQGAQNESYDRNGALTSKGAYVSDWMKYAWFRDWKEYMVDELDDDPGTSNVEDGIIFQEVVTQGMTDEFPIQFWISTNNNRVAMVLMGDPTLDQDNFLTSFAYLGRIHPFYDKQCVVKKTPEGTTMLDINGDPVLEEKRTYFQNDVSGNFAITSGSSTLPVAIGAPPQGAPIMETVEIAIDDKGVRMTGDLYDFTSFGYVVTYLTEVGESRPTGLDQGRKIVPRGEIDPLAIVPQIGVAMKIRFRLPEEATGYRIYRFHDAERALFGAEANLHTNYKLVTSVTKLDRQRTVEYIDNGYILPMHSPVYDAGSDSTTYKLVKISSDVFYAKFLAAVPSARSFESVVRDKFTGATIEVKFSDKWGKDTATGVNDIMMYQTRSGLKYQRHSAAFITTEEFMPKEKSGQSRWTGKFHLSPVYIEHSYDKQRGWFDGVMAVDDSGIEHLDELIVDKDTPTEEVYKFFRVNAPYSFFNNSPNYAYGLAIIKSSLRWE